jgi:hypothetical protein
MEQLARWGARLLAVLQETVQGLLTYLPVALTAAGVLLLGWLLARLARTFVRKAIDSMDLLFGRLMTRSSEGSQALSRATSRAVSSVVYWIVLLIFAATALRILGGPLFERWTEDLLAYLPYAFGGVLIIVAGLVGGTLVRHVVEQASAGLGIGQSAWLGRLAQGVVVASGIVIGVDQLGVDVSFLVQLATVTLAALLGGAALVFALGTRQHLANLISAHYARKRYQTGDYVRVGGFEGRIVEIADGCIFLESEEGDVSVPACHFSQDPFIKLRSEK